MQTAVKTQTSVSVAVMHEWTLNFDFALVMRVTLLWLIHSPVFQGFPAAQVGLVLLVAPEKKDEAVKTLVPEECSVPNTATWTTYINVIVNNEVNFIQPSANQQP